MPTPLIPQEIYLLERYSDKEYFAQMRDAWAAMLEHVEDCLQRFMLQLPPDYRKRRLPYQPDSVWGQLVLPNFRASMQRLNEGYIRLTHGDYECYGAEPVMNDFRGAREYSDDWMDEVEPGASDKYWKLIGKASHFASNIDITRNTYWCIGDLTKEFEPRSRDPLNPPSAWPRYRLNPSVQVHSNEPILQTGIYLPEVDDACPQFLIASKHYTQFAHTAPQACVGLTPCGQQYESEQDTLWTLVERVPGETVPFELGRGLEKNFASPTYAGQPCPRSGYWFTLAEHGSRRHFAQDELLPSIPSEASRGLILWQWDADQNTP